MSRVRILFLLDQLASGRGGSEQHLLWLLERLPTDRFDTHFVVMTAVRTCDPKSLPICPIVLSVRVGLGKLHWGRRLKHLMRLIRQHDIDVVQSFCRESELFALFATRLAGQGRVIGARRNTGYALRTKDRLFSLCFSQLIAGYVANSAAAKQVAVRGEGIRGDKIVVIPNPVFEQRITSGVVGLVPRVALAAEAEAQIIGMVATGRPIKDHLTLMRAARIVVDRYPRARFVLVGEWQKKYLKEVDALIAELNLLDNVLFYGGIDNPFSLIPHFDVGVLSSQSESFSNSVLEYAAAGIPAVVTDVGGLREIVHEGKNGFVVPPRDPVALAEKVCVLLSDPELRRRFGEYGRNHVRAHYGEEEVLRRYCEVYERVALSRQIALVNCTEIAGGSS